MPDREKVIRGLKHCKSTWMCNGCPYEDDSTDDCPMYDDALALIREPSAWDVFETITTAYDGKQTFFRQDSGTVYDRYSGDYCTFDEAVQRFARRVAQWEN